MAPLRRAEAFLWIAALLGIGCWATDLSGFAPGFFWKFGPCVDRLNESRALYGMFFVPQALALLAAKAPAGKSLRCIGVSSLLFYLLLGTLWSAPGCFNNYELICWGGMAAGFWALAIASGGKALGASCDTRAKKWAAGLAMGLSALGAWRLCSGSLFYEYGFLNKPLQGVWIYASPSSHAALSILLYGCSPWILGKLAGNKAPLFSFEGALCSAAGLLCMAAPYWLGMKAADIEPVSFSGMAFPVLLAALFRMAKQKEKTELV